MDIIIYNSFQVVRGKKTAYEIADYLLECPNADAADDGDGDEEEDAGRSGTSSSRPDAEDCFGLELDEEAGECQQGDSSEAAPLLSQWERKRKGVDDILKSKNIVHSHVNQGRNSIALLKSQQTFKQSFQ